MMRIRPVVVKPFPDAARPFGDIGPIETSVVHLQVRVGTVA